jgi:hypothetical protein
MPRALSPRTCVPYSPKSIITTKAHMKSNCLGRALAGIAAALVLSGCALTNYSAAKWAVVTADPRRDFGRSLTTKFEPGQPSILTVSGGIVHSSWGIRNMETLREKETIIIKMHMVHAGFGRTNLYGEFSYRIEIPEDVNYVRIGKCKTNIWSRTGNTGPAPVRNDRDLGSPSSMPSKRNVSKPFQEAPWETKGTKASHQAWMVQEPNTSSIRPHPVKVVAIQSNERSRKDNAQPPKYWMSVRRGPKVYACHEEQGIEGDSPRWYQL